MGTGASVSKSAIEGFISSVLKSDIGKPEVTENESQVIRTEFLKILHASKSGDTFAATLIDSKECIAVVRQCDVTLLKTKLSHTFQNYKQNVDDKLPATILPKISVYDRLSAKSDRVTNKNLITTNSAFNSKLMKSGQNVMSTLSNRIQTPSDIRVDNEIPATRSVRTPIGRRTRSTSESEYSNLGSRILRQSSTGHLDIDKNILRALEQANALFKTNETTETTVKEETTSTFPNIRNRRSSYLTGEQRIERMVSISEMGVDNSDMCSVYTSTSNEAMVDQLSCALCHVFFETEGQKERHIKHSASHATMLADIEQKRKLLEVKPKTDEEEERIRRWQSIRKASVQSLRGGGALIHSSCHFFWRTREDVQILVYLHMKTKHLEVIPIDFQTDFEYLRMYFSVPHLDDIVIAKNERRRYTLNEGENKEFFIQNRETTKLTVLCNYIINHLQMVEADVDTNTIKHIVYVPGSMDLVPEAAFLLNEVPPGLVPANPSRKKPISRNPSVDFSNTFEVLQIEKLAYKEALKTAETLSENIDTL